MSNQSFINEVAPHAQTIQKNYNILASIIIAQACHESRFGQSGLATKGKNLFGVKGTYNGQAVNMLTWEHYNGKDVQIYANFRKYPTWYESLQDLANLYKNGVSWDRNKYKSVIGETDYKKAAKAVQTSGYATDPNYATSIIKMIETYNLTQYDKGGKVTTVKVEDKVADKDVKSYTVKGGDTLGEIADDFGTTVDALVKLNKLADKNKIYVGQVLLLTSDAKALTTISSSTYTVKSGDALSKIAAKYGMSTNEIAELNDIEDVNKIFPGQVLKVTGKAETTSEPKYIKVGKNDTVSGLAKKYGSTQAQIKSWNKLADINVIQLGQKLRVK